MLDVSLVKPPVAVLASEAEEPLPAEGPTFLYPNQVFSTPVPHSIPDKLNNCQLSTASTTLKLDL